MRRQELRRGARCGFTLRPHPTLNASCFIRARRRWWKRLTRCWSGSGRQATLRCAGTSRCGAIRWKGFSQPHYGRWFAAIAILTFRYYRVWNRTARRAIQRNPSFWGLRICLAQHTVASPIADSPLPAPNRPSLSQQQTSAPGASQPAVSPGASRPPLCRRAKSTNALNAAVGLRRLG